MLFILCLVLIIVSFVFLFVFLYDEFFSGALAAVIVFGLSITGLVFAINLPRVASERTLVYELEKLPETNKRVSVEPKAKGYIDIIYYVKEDDNTYQMRKTEPSDTLKINISAEQLEQPYYVKHITHHSNGWLFPGGHNTETVEFIINKEDITADNLKLITVY